MVLGRLVKALEQDETYKRLEMMVFVGIGEGKVVHQGRKRTWLSFSVLTYISFDIINNHTDIWLVFSFLTYELRDVIIYGIHLNSLNCRSRS